MIVNLDKHTEPGSHWVGIGRDKKDDILWVYDSFGGNTHIILKSIYKVLPSDVIIKDTENDAEQNKKQNDCGARSLSFLWVLHKYGSKYAKWI